MKPIAPTTEELRMAFERACANRLVRWSLAHSALAYRAARHLPAQQRLTGL